MNIHNIIKTHIHTLKDQKHNSVLMNESIHLYYIASKELVTVGKRKVNSLLRILNNPCLSLYVKRQVILSILRPSLELSEV